MGQFKDHMKWHILQEKERKAKFYVSMVIYRKFMGRMRRRMHWDYRVREKRRTRACITAFS